MNLMLTMFHWWKMLRNFRMHGVIYCLQGYSLVNSNLLYYHMEE